MKKDTIQELINLFSVIHRTIRQRMAGYHSDLHNLSLMQWQALVFIKRQHRVTMSDLARQFEVSGAAATMLVDRLVEAGLLIREKDEEDRRVVYLVLTPETDSKFEKLFKKKQETMKSFLEVLDDHDAEELLRILRKIHNNLYNSDKEGESL